MTTADFDFTTRRGLHDSAGVVVEFAALVPLPQSGPHFDFTTRRGLHDPADVLAQFAGVLPVPHTGPDFDFTTRRGLHDPADVLALFGAPPIVLEGIPPPEQSSITFTRRFNQRFTIRPPASEPMPIGPTFTAGAGNIRTISGLAGPAGAPSTITFTNRPVIDLTRSADDTAGYGAVALAHAPGARNVTVLMVDDDPPMPGWIKLKRKAP